MKDYEAEIEILKSELTNPRQPRRMKNNPKAF